MAAQDILHDFVRDDLLPAAVDRLPEAAGQVQVAGRIYEPDVAGAKPPTGEKGRRIGRGIVEVPGNTCGPQDDDLASLVVCKLLRRFVNDADVALGVSADPGRGASRPRFYRDARCLGQSIPVEDGYTQQ